MALLVDGNIPNIYCIMISQGLWLLNFNTLISTVAGKLSYSVTTYPFNHINVWIVALITFQSILYFIWWAFLFLSFCVYLSDFWPSYQFGLEDFKA